MANLARLLLMIVILVFTCGNGVCFAGQSWERLQDGRVVIDLLGERLAFDPQDAALVSFWRTHDGHNYTLTLDEALNDVDKAREFSNGPGVAEYGIWVDVQVSGRDAQNPGRPFLGKFPWADLPTTSPTKPLEFSIVPGGQSTESITARYPTHNRAQRPPNKYFPEAKGTSQVGFTAYPSMTAYSIKRGFPTETYYVLPGARRQPPSNIDLLVICSVSGSPWRYCAFQQLSADLRLAMFLEWGENSFPESSWVGLDQLARTIAADIFIDHTREDFQ